jgi:hypothetical protein
MDRYVYVENLKGRFVEGQWGLMTENDNKKLLMMDGSYIDVKDNEIWQFNQYKIDMKKWPKKYQDQSKNLVNDNPLKYQFEIIDLNNDVDDKHALLETALM